MKQLFQKLQDANKLKLIAILVASSAFSLFIGISRVFYTHKITYGFLLWNLFLAWIPFIISTYIVLRQDKIARPLFWLLTVMWLLFFPNAPYILTDIFHLKQRIPVPLWFDLILVLSYAWTGLLLGLLSLMDLHKIITQRAGIVTGWLFAFISIGLGSFGIYLGRYQRWNSWDVFTNPFSLASDIAHKVIHPFTNPRLFGITIFFTVFLMLVYSALHFLKSTDR
jgi:uncharacterized membrane protein